MAVDSVLVLFLSTGNELLQHGSLFSGTKSCSIMRGRGGWKEKKSVNWSAHGFLVMISLLYSPPGA